MESSKLHCWRKHTSPSKRSKHTHTLLSGAIRWSVWVKTSSFKWINGKSIAHNTTWSTQWSCHRLRRLMSQRCLAFIELKREHLEDFMERLWDVGTGKDGDITNTPRCLLEKWSREWIIIISPSWNEVILGWFLWRKPSFTVTSWWGRGLNLSRSSHLIFQYVFSHLMRGRDETIPLSIIYLWYMYILYLYYHIYIYYLYI